MSPVPAPAPAPAPQPVIALEGVAVAHGEAVILDGVSLEVPPTRVIALLGRSGAGKSTLLRVVMGFIAPRRGVVRVRGEVVSAHGRVRVPPAARDLAMVFQDLALWPHLSVAGNLAFGLRARGVGRAERGARIGRILAEVGLADKATRAPGELSQGERQRVAIARALVLEPDVVLLDEPLSNVDLGLRAELLELFARLFREHHTAALFVTHDPRQVRRLGATVAVLEGGRIVASGPPDSLDLDHDSAFVRLVAQELHGS